MSTRRRTRGDETWNRLLHWTDSQKASERLAGHILAHEGFAAINPSHPLGGPDGLKDSMCGRDGILWVASVYFPNGKHSFKQVRSKFESDARGVISNNAQGFVFVTNQYLTVSQRRELEKNAPVDHVELYHLERIVHILDTPINYGTRLEFLDIEMTKEELLAHLAAVADEQTKKWQQFQEQQFRDELREEIRGAIQEALSQQRFTVTVEELRRIVQESLSQQRR